jgi:DNA (cytosine-5)-methyltransferase 1
MRTVAFCEIEPYCRAVLRKHWPDVPCYTDIRELTAARLAADGISVDLICGGFPCQDISLAGAGAGIAGERSGLWREYARLIREIRPRFVVVENVAALLGRGICDVLGDLAAVGYDAQWDCIPAAAVGALHFRDRVWIVAYPDSNSVRPQRIRTAAAGAWCEQQFARLVQDQIRVSLPTGSRSGISDGVSGRMGQLKGYGNAVVPQIPEIIGRAIMRAAA